jgi:lipopolysaccharide/colanic/teichoic acid biosynthesis glycosyltransferase
MLQSDERGTLRVPGRMTHPVSMPVPPVLEAFPGGVLAEEAARADWLVILGASHSQPTSRLLYGLVVKRWLDAVAASLLIVMLLPVMIVAAVLIQLQSPGSVIFRQTRIGRNGQPFTIYKFRTMIGDRRARQKPFSGEERRRRHKTANDPRVTRAGKLLRRTSIDELPQLFNILRGDMSFVGPRPELPHIVARYEDWQHGRHLVTPGLSGWWQVTGRSDLPMHEHTDLDIYYVENQSFMLDLQIVLRTFKALMSRGGAF